MKKADPIIAIYLICFTGNMLSALYASRIGDVARTVWYSLLAYIWYDLTKEYARKGGRL